MTYTFRTLAEFLAEKGREDILKELSKLFEIGIITEEGLIVSFPSYASVIIRGFDWSATPQWKKNYRYWKDVHNWLLKEERK